MLQESNLERFSRKEIAEAQENAEKFMQSIRADSIMAMERPERIKELIFQGSLGIKIPIFTNWICPRGTNLAPDEATQKLFRRYTQTEPKDGFETDYQILPRIELEKSLCKKLERFSTNASYLKIVADDNPYCLYPACLRIDGEEKTMDAIENYSKYCQTRFDESINQGKVEVQTWSEILGTELFKKYLECYEQTKLEDLLPFLPKNIVDLEMDILTDHTKPSQNAQKYFETFAIDCARYFAVEGLFLSEIFRDDVIVAWNDSTRLTRTIDALRLKNGLPALPKIYVLHEKRDGKIVNDF